ncbi:UPF0193 protein EVG1 like [Schistosoma japonicum]|nr:UPF0193 protein EVG1 like [Schistosoma japonicum]
MSNGGFWNTHKVNYSDETKKILNDLVNESKLANFYRHSISEAIKNGESLNPDGILISSVGKRPLLDQKAKRTKRHKVDGVHDSKTSRHALNTGASEKLRLAHLMTYGEEPIWKSSKNDQIKDGRLEYLSRRILKYPKVDDNDCYDDQKKIESSNKDRFEELIDEINERREFLAQMESFGRAKEYRTPIETEISQLIREMEMIDIKRTKQMYQDVTSN